MERQMEKPCGHDYLNPDCLICDRWEYPVKSMQFSPKEYCPVCQHLIWHHVGDGCAHMVLNKFGEVVEECNCKRTAYDFSLHMCQTIVETTEN